MRRKQFIILSVFAKAKGRSARKEQTMLSEAVVVTAAAEKSGTEKYGRLRTDSPDGRINLLMNFWAEKQIRYCSIGKKAVRDNSQLAVGFLNFDTEYALKTIEECLEHQYSDGHAVLLWYPIVDKTLYSDPAVLADLRLLRIRQGNGRLYIFAEKLCVAGRRIRNCARTFKSGGFVVCKGRKQRRTRSAENFPRRLERRFEHSRRVC